MEKTEDTNEKWLYSHAVKIGLDFFSISKPPHQLKWIVPKFE